MRKLLILLLLSGCGFFQSKTKTEILAAPAAKTLEVGDTWRYVYVPERSSRIILNAEVEAQVAAIDETSITVLVNGEAKTTLGNLPIRSTQVIPKDVLSFDTLELLRQHHGLILPNVVLEYVKLTREGCDYIKAYSITGADGLEVLAKVCAQTASIPEFEAQHLDLGLKLFFVNVK